MIASPLVPGRVLLAVGLLAIALTACGRRGALEPPPDGRAVTPDRAQLVDPPPPYQPPDRPFFLDPLI